MPLREVEGVRRSKRALVTAAAIPGDTLSDMEHTTGGSADNC